MKYSKTALLSTIAAAGMVISGIAPQTVSAATSAYDNEGKLVTGGQSVNIADGAYSDPTQGAKATSTANVTVISGFLSLEAVPDFSFGRAISGSIAKLDQGEEHAIPSEDGNSDGILRVVESRDKKTSSDTSSSKATNQGFEVTATIGKFTGDDNKPVDGFILNLAPQSFNNTDGKPSGLSTKALTLNPDNDSTATGSILNVKDTDEVKGSYQAVFNSANAATLKVPDAATAGKDGKDGISKYKGVITWTLNAKASGTA
ncbi:WxL domain-containing protein [Companilactobacillus ginsenosidimutans]|uniref:WxL domain-containing protein n=1 Tax=Companilactobacillus ginsenosidimutans TaxID=1007676 RepID=A0A0H4QMV9_9LACO|nr:WxL domain-containing protein [Companilactobacillus ginsenosidimutans]AKP68053.1 hypothetical protein ABM34_11245 [Companilactobacillus ginsenosidimutans]